MSSIQLFRLEDENGRAHCIGGPAVKYSNGDETWVIHGDYHREDGGPAYMDNYQLIWFRYGKVHRPDGPAMVFLSKTPEYWMNGLHLTFEDFKKQYLITNLREYVPERFVSFAALRQRYQSPTNPTS